MLAYRESRHAQVLCSALSNPALDVGVVEEEHTLQGCHSVGVVGMWLEGRAGPLRQAEPWRPGCPEDT